MSIDVEDKVWREIQVMTRSGWQLYGRFPGGADFVNRSGSGISGAMHVILILLTLGLWIPVMILIELIHNARPAKFMRVTIDQNGLPVYKEIGKPNA